MNQITSFPRQDRKRLRAHRFAAAIAAELDEILPYQYRRAVHERLFEILYVNGVSWTTEEERVRLGFEPRDEKGWSASEQVELQQRLDLLNMERINNLTKVMPMQTTED